MSWISEDEGVTNDLLMYGSFCFHLWRASLECMWGVIIWRGVLPWKHSFTDHREIRFLFLYFARQPKRAKTMRSFFSRQRPWAADREFWKLLQILVYCSHCSLQFLIEVNLWSLGSPLCLAWQEPRELRNRHKKHRPKRGNHFIELLVTSSDVSRRSSLPLTRWVSVYIGYGSLVTINPQEGKWIECYLCAMGYRLLFLTHFHYLVTCRRLHMCNISTLGSRPGFN